MQIVPARRIIGDQRISVRARSGKHSAPDCVAAMARVICLCDLEREDSVAGSRPIKAATRMARMANTEREKLAESRDARLALVVEPTIEPALPIIDPHHHLWDHPESRYLLDEILRDTNSGHNVLATVVVECFSI